jgi:hypothetical protein
MGCYCRYLIRAGVYAHQQRINTVNYGVQIGGSLLDSE